VSAYHARTIRYRLVAFAQQLGGTPAAIDEAPMPLFHFETDDVRAIVASIPESAKRAAVLETDQRLEQKFSFRGIPEIHFSQAIDWNFAPDGNLSWSWDLNRHRFFLTLGTAYHYTQDAAYLDQLVALWHDWMRRNPAGKGSNWSSPFEVAARLRNWIWAYFLLGAAPGVDSLFLRRAWSGISQHAAFLADHLEYHWPNNHLLLEALSLCEFAVVFRAFGGERYLPLASKALVEQVEQQVLADGVHSELCPMYHEIVASELSGFAHLCHKLHHSLPAATTQRIRAMRRFSVAMRRCDGSFPLLGDSSSPDTCLRFDLAHIPRGDLAYWLQPDSGALESSIQSPLSLDLFAEAGYGILRGSGTHAHLIFDFGPWSRSATTNHGHSDALSFEFHVAGRPWIVDSGYFHSWKDRPGEDGLPWSHYFRSTAAHNTLLIDGREQFEFSERGEVGRQARTRLVGYRSSSEEVSVCGEVQPYWSDHECVHRREIALSRMGEVTVRDRILPGSKRKTATRQLQWFFHFAADLAVELLGTNIVVARGDGKMLTCEVCGAGPAPRLRLIRGQEAPRQGWVAHSSAVIAPSWVLAVEAESLLPYEMHFRFGLGLFHEDFQTQEFCAGRRA
jgi:uncharacterized heparinase superfamily protein